MILFPKAYDVWLYFREPANFIKFYAKKQNKMRKKCQKIAKNSIKMLYF